jgi:hypothetical protein
MRHVPQLSSSNMQPVHDKSRGEQENCSALLVSVSSIYDTGYIKRKPEALHGKKKVIDFPVTSRDVTYQTLSGRELFLINPVYPD